MGERVRLLCVCFRGRSSSGSSTSASGPSSPSPAEKPAEKPAVQKQEGAGLIVELGPASIVAGSVPEGLAGRVAEHFVRGDRVKMTCRESELTDLETVV